ncbi:hypothetical protein SLA2020_439080 [Shorea laevis]
MELELGSDRSGVDCGSDGSDLGQAQGPNLRIDINQPHILQAQPPSPRRRAHPHRPRFQPQHRAHRLLLHHHVHLLRGLLAGSAQVQAGSQSPRSCQLLRLPARLQGLQLAHHAARFIADVARREMVLDAAVDIAGTAKVLWWDHKFKVHVESRVTVDPVFFEVIDQDIKSETEVLLA